MSTSINMQACRGKEARVSVEVDDLYDNGKLTTFEIRLGTVREGDSDSVTLFLPGAPHDAVSHMITALQAILEPSDHGVEPSDHGGWERASATFTLREEENDWREGSVY